MKTLNIVFDDETAKVLATFPNKSQIVREAVNLYYKDATTGTFTGMARAFTQLLNEFRESQERFAELYEMVESTKHQIEEVSNR